MQFHDYKTMKPSDYRGTSESYIRELMMIPACERGRDEADTIRGAIEMGWFGCDRPFYNVYPIAVDLCVKTSLNMKWGDIMFPDRYLCLRFANGHEPLGIKSCLVRVPSNAKQSTNIEFHRSRFRWLPFIKATPLAASITNKQNGDHNVIWSYPGSSIRDEVIGDTLSRGWDSVGLEEFEHARHQTQFIIRLLAFIGLLARGTDLITPAILSKDRDEYDATGDESRRRWLEDRAARRLGRGFDIGRSLEIERASSPHWRSPHLALFHTGRGRSTPVLKVRSGCVVIPKDMSSVPTGYMGAELPGEQPVRQKPFSRTPIPWKLRFRIMRRDNKRCQMCGMTAADGVRLEVDHKVPVAKGGKTVEDNLWVLCQPCNGGKSDSDLHLATAQGGEASGI